MAREARPEVGDLLRLGARLGGGWLKGADEADPGAVLCRWAREVMERERADGLRLGVGDRGVHLIGARASSDAVLGAHPGADGWATSALKAEAMGFLAPGALTVTDGPGWGRLRSFNERVLGDGAPHPDAPAFLGRVRAAFARPVADVADVRAAMGRAMVGIVLGDAEPGRDLAADVATLFGVVQNPVRRKLTGILHRRRRARVYEALGRRWDEARPEDRTLVARARAQPDAPPREQALQQVPHWMFTFTGSGTDLLARTLALLGSRPEARGRVLAELAGAGPADDADTLGRLPWTNACILEAGRLFPPVTRTFHRSTGGSGAGPSGEVVHWFPLLQRWDRLDPTVHDFRPERWLGAAPDAAAEASNLFLRGPRACPGRELILLVCRAAVARQVGELGLVARAPSRLSRDPLPVSFPERAARFTHQGAT